MTFQRESVIIGVVMKDAILDGQIEADQDFVSKLKAVAEASRMRVVPPKLEEIPRLSKQSLRVLGWSEEDEIFGNSDVTMALAAIRRPDDRTRFSEALRMGNIAVIQSVANEIVDDPWKSQAPVAGFLGLVSDYLDTFRHQPVVPLSPRTEGGIY